MTYDLIHQVTYQGRTGSVVVDKSEDIKDGDITTDGKHILSNEFTTKEKNWYGAAKIIRATKSLQLPVDELVMPEKREIENPYAIICDLIGNPLDALDSFLNLYIKHYDTDEDLERMNLLIEDMKVKFNSFRSKGYKSDKSAGCYTEEDIKYSFQEGIRIARRAGDMNIAVDEFVKEIINTLHPLPKTLTIEGGKESWGW